MLDLFRLMGFLLRTARHLPMVRTSMLAVIVTGILAGLGNTALLALANSSLHSDGALENMGWAFLALCLMVPISRFVSQYLLASMSSRVVFDLRLELCRRTLSSPLRNLENIGAARVFAHLTDDVGAISESLVQVPLLTMHAAIVVGCLSYLGWLSWPMLLWVMLAMVVGVLSYQLPILSSMRYFRRARESWDRLFGHFEGMTRGIKELKLHRERRQAFIRNDLTLSAEEIRSATLPRWRAVTC